MRAALPSIVLILTMSAYGASTLGQTLPIPIRGSVIIEYVSSEADFINTLVVRSPPGVGVSASNCALSSSRGLIRGLHILSGNRSQPGCRVLLDANVRRLGTQVFPPSDVFSGKGGFEFSLCSQEVGRSGCSFVWSSNRSENLDRLQHVVYLIEEGDRSFLVQWEDSPQGGDMDFNDLVVRVKVRPCAAQQ